MAVISHTRLRIAMLSIHSSPIGALGTQNTGGMSVYVRESAKWLGRQGHTVDIFTYVNSSDRPIDLYPNVRLIHLNPAPNAGIDKAHLPTHIKTIYTALENYCRSHQLGYDVIHSHYWISAVVGAMAQTRWHCPHLITFHTLGAAKNSHSTVENEPVRRIAHERWLAKVADGIVAPSDGERRNLLCLYHPRQEIIHTIPCGVDLNRFQPMDRSAARKTLGMPANAQVALYVGRFAPVKGINTLFEAVAGLTQDMPRLHLVVVGGDGPKAESSREFIDYVNQKQLNSRVTFAGRIEQEDLPLYYCAADFLALPSLYESFGLVVLEALACGTPVVATPVGVAEALISEGLNGVVAERADATSMARAISRMLAAPAGTQETIRATVATFNWEAIAASMVKTYGELLEGYTPIGCPPPAAAQNTSVT